MSWEAAEAAGLRLLVGLEYLDWRLLEPGRRSRRAICDAGRRAVEEALEACRDHRGAIFGISVGNEIPTDVVRVHGISAVQDQLSELVRLLHNGDPSLLATYVSFPTTEYLDVEGIDFLAFNVFLERPGELARYTCTSSPMIAPSSSLNWAWPRRSTESNSKLNSFRRNSPRWTSAERPAPSSSHGPTNGLSQASRLTTGQLARQSRQRARLNNSARACQTRP
jgi:hypothetical protein